MRDRFPTRKSERLLLQRGYLQVAGVDEVGRGSLAGPVAVAAVVLPEHANLPRVRDSKLLSLSQREMAAAEIRRCGAQIGIGWTHATHIDELGLTQALRLAALQALGGIKGVDMVLLDGRHNYLKGHIPNRAIVGGDNLELAIAAASVMAKAARDRWMKQLHIQLPQYGFGSNVGYGTSAHLAALSVHGLSEWHRRSFAPIREFARVN